MTICFKSDHLKTSAGFTAYYYSQPSFQYGKTCGGRLESVSGSFTSPNYPERYPNNAECIWYIQVANGKRITLNLDDFQLEVSLRCTNDYVAIYDGSSTSSPMVAKFCSGSNHTLTSSSNTMTIYFRSDHLKTSAGFTAYYFSQALFQSAARPDGIRCGGRLESDSGSFTSPSYPEPYPNNAKCIWYIQVANRHRITLNLDGFQLEVSSQCTNDYVAIYDGASTKSPLIATVCSGSNHVFRSSSNTMTVYFKSDHIKASAGFSAYYYSVPLFQTGDTSPLSAVDTSPLSGDTSPLSGKETFYIPHLLLNVDVHPVNVNLANSSFFQKVKHHQYQERNFCISFLLSNIEVFLGNDNSKTSRVKPTVSKQTVNRIHHSWLINPSTRNRPVLLHQALQRMEGLSRANVF
ncbi:scavenger receptor cysteine-rich domain-containing protein DMBT1-like [Scyliorhinus torazame]|uniref:scavenger receptor cysteine-rich domain-containing protein DMBT1-like n=1 Tax=Scyliorhinus torazame TaxID=75743 RepID=UPI003B58FB8D